MRVKSVLIRQLAMRGNSATDLFPPLHHGVRPLQVFVESHHEKFRITEKMAFEFL